MHSLRFFSNAEVAERLSYPQLIEALRIGLAKPCSAPLRSCHALPAQASLLQMRRPIASVALPPPAKRWCAAHG